MKEAGRNGVCTDISEPNSVQQNFLAASMKMICDVVPCNMANVNQRFTNHEIIHRPIIGYGCFLTYPLHDSYAIIVL